MRLPSVKTLSTIFGDKAKEARRLLEVDTREIQTDAALELRRQCYNPPAKYMVRFVSLDVLGEFHGVESIEFTNGEFADYLNAGDTYEPTLIYWRGAYRVQSMGDFVETMERRGLNAK